VDDTPKAFVEELRSAVLKKRVGQIALAVVLAQAVWRLLNSFTWFLVMPVVRRFLEGQNQSVLFGTAGLISWDNVLGSVMEFLLTVVVVFYLNRWIHRRSRVTSHTEEGYTLVGEKIMADDGRNEPRS
jgi:large-conductance mechanosensitive channel